MRLWSVHGAKIRMKRKMKAGLGRFLHIIVILKDDEPKSQSNNYDWSNHKKKKDFEPDILKNGDHVDKKTGCE